MRMKQEVYLRKDELQAGKKYKVLARNFQEATWDGKVFIGMRNKFGHLFEDTEFHWDDGAPYGTVKPLHIIEEN